MSQAAANPLDAQLKTLHLASILQHYQERAQAAAEDGWPYETYLATLIQEEVDRRTQNRLRRRIKEARFPLRKELADFDFAALPHLNKQKVLNLAQGHYLDRAEPVILVGNPGLGKTHVAVGLGLAACRQDHRVRFYTVTGLINELHQVQEEHRLPKFLEKARRHRLIILDELGYVPFSATGAQLLFQFCSTLSEQVSLIVTTNLPFSEWIQVLGDERLASGLLDRLTFRSHILEFRGESYRFRHQQQQQTAIS